jgi:hypothetical protein
MLTWRGPTCYISISILGTEATISRIFQKLYIFHMILDEDDFYIKIVALDEILKLTAYKKDMIFSRR